jgi:streptomycin 6-kinase
MFGDYLERWQLMPDGEPIITRSSRLLPVRLGGVPAMLKIALLDEERIGGLLMQW